MGKIINNSFLKNFLKIIFVFAVFIPSDLKKHKNNEG